MAWLFLLIIPIGFLVYFLKKHDITQTEWFYYGLLKNQYLWFHMLFAGIGSKIFIQFMNMSTTIFVVFIIAVGWEVLEYFMEGNENYKNFSHYMWDTFFDIVMAVLICVICIL